MVGARETQFVSVEWMNRHLEAGHDNHTDYDANDQVGEWPACAEPSSACFVFFVSSSHFHGSEQIFV